MSNDIIHTLIYIIIIHIIYNTYLGPFLFHPFFPVPFHLQPFLFSLPHLFDVHFGVTVKQREGRGEGEEGKGEGGKG